MILSYVSVLILIMSPVLRAALVAPNSLSIQEILDYCVNYILINAFIWNSSQAFLKFFLITRYISTISKLSHFFLQPFFTKSQKVKDSVLFSKAPDRRELFPGNHASCLLKSK